MKRMLAILCLLLGSEQTVFSDWKLGKIYNDSDLKLESAWRHKHKSKPRYISTVTSSLNKAKPSQRVTDITYSVSSKQDPMSILVKNNTETYDIFFDSHATHSLEWKRGKTQKAAPSLKNQGCSITDGPNCARVWMTVSAIAKGNGWKPVGGIKEISAAFYAHDEEPMITLDLTIKGINGSYSLSLSEQAG
ncbi:MAG: hypothetical protein NTZ68_04545 [Candidatus Dependentiae bacterium]|nr:hypothetical protein [Candidatus Dependentiae bacterium]